MKFNFDKFLPKYEINTPKLRAAFLSQCHYESQGFTRIEENLSYSTLALIQTWPRCFSSKNAGCYAHQPQLIANRAYANRMGNGDENSGDGWRFRGRGLLQITGRNNYTMFAKFLKVTLEETIAYLETPDGAIEGACWYWQANNLNEIAATGDIAALTRHINGGLHGLAERESLYARYLAEEEGKNA